MGFLLDSLTDRVAVYLDANADGHQTGGRGGVIEDYQPVAGLGAVPCKVAFVRGRTSLQFEHPGCIALYTVTLGVPCNRRPGMPNANR